MFRGVVLLAAVAALSAPAHAFAPPGMLTSSRGTRFQLSMGYVPDGMSPEQWKKMQAKEKSKSKGKNLGATGITKFQSRSLQAWQEAGAKHLFPTDPTNKKKEELPYMMRRGGSWDGADIKGKGVGQGKAFQRTKTDEEYEKKRKQGMLDSVSIFGGQSLPWSNDATRAMARPQQSEVEKKMMKKGQAKKAAEPAKDGNAKKFFGLF